MKTIISIVILTMSLLASPSLFAHAHLVSSTPLNNQSLEDSPKEFWLRFNKPVRLVKFKLVNDSNEVVETEFSMSKDLASEYSVANKNELKKGVYKVKWTIMGVDSHKLKGQLTFAVQ